MITKEKLEQMCKNTPKETREYIEIISKEYLSKIAKETINTVERWREAPPPQIEKVLQLSGRASTRENVELLLIGLLIPPLVEHLSFLAYHVTGEDIDKTNYMLGSLVALSLEKAQREMKIIKTMETTENVSNTYH